MVTHVFGTLSTVHVGASAPHISITHKTSRRRRSTTTRLPRFARTAQHRAASSSRSHTSSHRHSVAVRRPRPSHATGHTGRSRVAGTRRPHPAHATKTGLSALEARRANMAKARAREATTARSAKQLEADLRNLLLIRSGLKGARKTGPTGTSPASRAAALANLAKARAVSASRPRSPAQLAAARRNIVRAQLAARSRPRTAAQLAASRRNIARARIVGAHRPRSAAQIAAARRNLARARLRRHR